MFDDFEFEDKYNPWDVKSLEEFLYYCCPECPSKNVTKTDFIKHALEAHPQSQGTIEFLEDNKAVINMAMSCFTMLSIYFLIVNRLHYENLCLQDRKKIKLTSILKSSQNKPKVSLNPTN